jgi:hypothetical protein
MLAATKLAQWTVRIAGIIALVLGIMLWTGNGAAFRNIHMLVGIVLVVALWVVAFFGARAGAMPLAIGAGVFGAVAAIFGMVQISVLPGDLHWIVQVVHLLIGVGAIGMGEALAARVKRAAV